MSTIKGLTAEEYEAFRTVQSCADDGFAFDRRKRETSIAFLRAVEEARHLRAFDPGRLLFAVHYPHLYEREA